MVELALRQNTGAGVRSPSRRGHLWRRRRAAGKVSSQICGSGEGGFPGCGRLPTLPWSLCSLSRSRRNADDVVFPLADHGGEGEEGDGTTVFLFRVVCVLLVVYGCRVLQLLLASLGGEGRRWLDVSTLNLPYGGELCRWFGSTARGSSFGGTACSSPSPACPVVWKRLLALTL
jgi:hypothetical protein